VSVQQHLADAAEPQRREDGPSDADLLAAVAAGSEPAFEELRRRYRSAVQSVCRAVLPDAADDCSQEVFVRVWQKAALYDAGRGSAPAWLLALARNVARNLCARRVPEPQAIEETAAADMSEPAVDGFWLHSALERLPPHELQVIRLAYFEDLSQAQIARALGVPLGTVKTWTRRGLNRLASLLGSEGLG
jgi:RNA polymerase sigma-70 factor (ECF subfamily)